jgi:hypothetical protein
VKAHPESPANHHTRTALGAALYRARRYQESIDAINQGIDMQGSGGDVRDWMFLAMAYKQLGNDVDGRRFLDKAREWMLPRFPELHSKTITDAVSGSNELPITPLPSTDNGESLPWDHVATFPLIYREAESLIIGTPR